MPHVLPQSAHPLPPPYQQPQHGRTLVTVIDADDFSDGEDGEAEVIEDFDGEVDDAASVQVSAFSITRIPTHFKIYQFHAPRDVLSDHLEKRVAPPVPARRLAPLPPRIQAHQRMVSSQHHPTVAHHIPSPTQLAPAPVTLTSHRSSLVPAALH